MSILVYSLYRKGIQNVSEVCSLKIKNYIKQLFVLFI